MDALHLKPERVCTLCGRFEEKCQRQGVMLRQNERAAVIRLLAIELYLNTEALADNAANLVSFAVFQGAAGHGIVRSGKYLDLPDAAAVYRHAAKHHPVDPEGFFDRYTATIQQLMTNEEFRDFWSSPWIFRYTILRHHNPERFLRGVTATISNLEANSLYASVPAWLVKQAAVLGHCDPKGHLEKHAPVSAPHH